VTQDTQSGAGDLAPGAQLAGYEIQERIGHGGMAVVYRALDLRLGRLVALKVLAPHLGEDEAFRQRFMRESRAAAGVDHPHIIPVFEAGESAGVLFIAMRYVGHGDLRKLIESQGRLTPERTARIAGQVAAALDAAHAHGLVHRDVKPANILLGQASGSDADHAYLSDFGLSKHSLTPSTLTSTGQFLGTLDYVSPEQIQGHPIDGRADQYALACAVVEMLTGAPPFSRGDSMALMWAQLEAAPPRLTDRRPDLPPAVDEVIAAAMSKSADGRFATCSEFAAALAAACQDHRHRPGPTTAPAEPVPADPFPASPYAADHHAASHYASDPYPAADYPAAHYPAAPYPAAPHPADPYPADAYRADPAQADPRPADPFRAGNFGADSSPLRAADRWSDAPRDWFRNSDGEQAAAEQTVRPGWRASADSADGPAPVSMAPFRPAVDAAWPAGAAPTRHDSPTSVTRPPRPGQGQGQAGRGRPGRHRGRNVALALLIIVVGIGGVVGIAYKLSHRNYRSLPPVTVYRTVPAASQDPARTVRDYFAAINDHRYLAAWRLGGASESYATFRTGFVGTAHDTVTILSTSGNVVTARLAATQVNGTVKTYQGTYTVTNGVISATDVQRVS
jgi:serine/threonine protein kinase